MLNYKNIFVYVKILNIDFITIYVNSFFSLILNFLPKTTFVFETFFLQFLTFYIVFLLFTTLSLFYVLFYLLLLIVHFGFILSFYQLELFAAFL